MPNFTTLHDAFEYCDEGDCDMISDRELFNFIATELLADGSKGAAWEKLDQDGNGCAQKRVQSDLSRNPVIFAPNLG